MDAELTLTCSSAELRRPCDQMTLLGQVFIGEEVKNNDRNGIPVEFCSWGFAAVMAHKRRPVNSIDGDVLTVDTTRNSGDWQSHWVYFTMPSLTGRFA